MAQGKRIEAMRVVDDAFDANPDNAIAVFTKARIYRRLAKAAESETANSVFLRQALQYAERATMLQAQNAAAWYNLACYMALLDGGKTEVLVNLQKAIELSPSLELEAWFDEDFVRFREDEDFQRLLGKQEPPGRWGG